MGLGNRHARRHDTTASRIAGGVEPRSDWDFQPGDKVMTSDGFPGHVTAVNDGPYGSPASYEVELFDGLGGGEYSSGQLSAHSGIQNKGSAVESYPELGNILVDRPDPAKLQVFAAQQASEKEHFNRGYEYGWDASRPWPRMDHSEIDWDNEHPSFHDGYQQGRQDAHEKEISRSSAKTAEVGGDPGLDEHNHLTWGGDSLADGGNKDADYSLMDQNDADERTASRAWDLVSHASVDPDFKFEFTSAWSDVRAKAKRIRSEGGVRITEASDGMVIAEVKGDHNVYEAGIQRMPNKSTVATWSCGCRWGAYHWGDSDDLSRFAGRMCSHALALQYEAQSRGMFGKSVYVDDQKPSWAPKRVVVKFDINEGRNISAPVTDLYRMPIAASLAKDESPLTVVARALSRCGEVKDEVGIALLAHRMPTQAVTAAVNDAWGEPGPPPNQYLPGPTMPPNANDNPASMGWASQADPASWQHAQDMPDRQNMYASLNHEGAADALSFGDAPSVEKTDTTPKDESSGGGGGMGGMMPSMPSMPGGGGGAAAAGEGAAAGGGAAAAAGGGEAAAGGLMRLLPLLLASHQDEDDAIFEATLHDQPEPALPSTDGADDDQSDYGDHAALPTASASFNGYATDPHNQASHEAVGASHEATLAPGVEPTGSDVAAAARQFLAKEALKDFSPAEQNQIINEGVGVRARNTDKMDITGTHYAAMEDDDPEGQDSWLA